jgi:competence protein ComEA
VIAGRSIAVVVALVMLAWIGRFATATPAVTGPVVLAGADSGAPAADPVAPVPAPLPPPPAPSAAYAPPLEIPATAASGPLQTHATRATTEEPVFVNHAGPEELRRLPGVGPKRAEAILALRQRLGHFQRVEDLLRVKGVGRAAIRKWRPLVRLDSPPAVPIRSPPDAAPVTP